MARDEKAHKRIDDYLRRLIHVEVVVEHLLREIQKLEHYVVVLECGQRGKFKEVQDG